MAGLQAALPREHYVDGATHRVERERVLLHEWTCVGRLDDLGLTEPGSACPAARTARGRRAARRVGARHDRPRRARCTRTTTCAATAARRSCRSTPSTPAAGALRDEVAALPLPLVDLRPRRLAAARAAHRRRRPRPVASSRCTRSARRRVGRLALAARHAVDRRAAARGARPRCPSKVVRYPLDTLVVGRRLVYDVAANWKVVAENYNECYHCGPVHPELSRLVPAFAGGGSDLTWDDGVPHREGAWTFTMSGTSDRAPFPDLDEHERVRHKGELVYPNLLLSLSAEHAAAFVLRPLAVDRTEVTCDLLFAPTRSRSRPSTRATPRSSGTSPTSRTGRSASPCSAGCPRAPTAAAGTPRWRTPRSTSGAGSSPASSDTATAPDDDHGEQRMTETYDLADRRPRRARLVDRVARRAPRPVGHRARAVRARPRERRLARQQPDPAPQLPHPRVRRPHVRGLRRLGRPRGRDRRDLRDRHRRRRPVPRTAPSSASTTTPRRWTPARCRARDPRRRRGALALAADLAARRHPRAVPGAHRHRARGARRRRDAAPGHGVRRRPARPHRGPRHRAPRRRRRRRDRRPGRSPPLASSSAPTPGRRRCSRPSAATSRSPSPRSRSPTSPRPTRSPSAPAASRCGSGWTSRPTTASRPTARTP